MWFCTINSQSVTPRDLLVRPLHGFDQRRPTRNGECGTWPQSHIDLSRCQAARSRLQHRRRRVWICAHSTCPVAASLSATRARQSPASTLALHPLLQWSWPAHRSRSGKSRSQQLWPLVTAGCASHRVQGHRPTSPFDQPLRGRFSLPVRSMQRVC